MNQVALSGGWESRAMAKGALDASARLWLIVAFVGQWTFVYYIGAVYWASALQGDFGRWAAVMPRGLIEGDVVGNVFLGAHVLLALVIIPQIRARALPFHRWNGRLYIAIALVMSVTGLYLNIAREGVSFSQTAININGVLIMFCAAMTWRYVRAGNIDRHRRWALRTFMVVSGVWFIRLGFSFWILINGGAPGHTENFDFDIFIGYASYAPLAVLELYFHTRRNGKAFSQFAVASGIFFVLTLGTATAIFAASQIMWLPRL